MMRGHAEGVRRMAKRILIVEDEDAIAESVEFALERDGFATVRAPTLARARTELPTADLVVLDLMLPDGSGFELLAESRRGRRIPVIILSSRDDELDRVSGLEMGADDYVTKPFSPREVVARVRAVLRRTESPPDAAVVLAASEVEVDRATRRAVANGHELELTRTEFELLASLLETEGRVLTRAVLIERIFGDGYVVTDRTIDTHVKTLRKKLADAGVDPNLVETVRGVGYRLGRGEAA